MRARREARGFAPRPGADAAAQRKLLLAKIHIAKAQLGLGEDGYRDVLRRVTGADSAGKLEAPQLEAVLKEMRRLGFKDAPPARKAGAPLSQKAQVRLIHALWKDLQPHVSDGSAAALRAFVQRQTKSAARPEGVSAPEFLGPEDGNRVVEGLKAWLARARQRARTRAEAEQEGTRHGG